MHAVFDENHRYTAVLSGSLVRKKRFSAKWLMISYGIPRDKVSLPVAAFVLTVSRFPCEKRSAKCHVPASSVSFTIV